MIKSKHILYLAFLVFIVLTFLFSAVPFFWDGTFFSETAVSFYDGTYSPLDCPTNLDNVTFPVFSTYLAFVWKLFGKSLLVSHLSMLPFLIGIAYEFHKFSKKFLTEKMLSLAIILLLIQPTIMTQSILMGYDIPLLYLFLVCLNLLLEEKYKLYQIIVTLVALYSIRGMFLALSLGIILFVLLYPKHKWKAISHAGKQHLFCIAIVVIWFVYHKIKTGWFIISPIHENTDEQIHSFSMMLRQSVFIVWKLIDFGQVVLWLVILIGGYMLYKQKKNSANFRILFIFILIPTLVTSLLMIPFSNPIGHRYFMFTYILLIPGCCFLLQQLKSNTIRIGLFSLCCAALLSGNFWLYPEKYGNGWDSSLKVLPYFQLKEQMDKYISESKIKAVEVGTQYPLIADKRYSHLSETPQMYTNVWSGPIEKYDYFLFTNVINTDIPEQVEQVKKEWILLKRIISGKVYMELYTKKGLLFFQF